MIMKYVQFKWTYVENDAFENIKVSISVVPSLQSPYFTKNLFLYTFPSDHSLAEVLTQKDEQGNECPIAFMRIGLQGDKLNYPPGKERFFVHKSIKQFKPYILKNHTKVIVPHLRGQISLYVEGIW
jgi:hypothetical protein